MDLISENPRKSAFSKGERTFSTFSSWLKVLSASESQNDEMFIGKNRTCNLLTKSL